MQRSMVSHVPKKLRDWTAPIRSVIFSKALPKSVWLVPPILLHNALVPLSCGGQSPSAKSGLALLAHGYPSGYSLPCMGHPSLLFLFLPLVLDHVCLESHGWRSKDRMLHCLPCWLYPWLHACDLWHFHECNIYRVFVLAKPDLLHGRSVLLFIEKDLPEVTPNSP